MANDGKNDHVIVAIFDNEEAADTASKALQEWDKANDDIKLGAVGTIYKKGDKIKTKMGRRTGKGAKVGATLGIVAGVLSGGLTIVAGAAAGAVGGGALGAFFKKSTNMTKEEIQELGTKLDAGKVALIVTLDENEVAATTEQLSSQGGQVQSYTIPAEALEEAAAAGVGADTEESSTEEATATTPSA